MRSSLCSIYCNFLFSIYFSGEFLKSPSFLEFLMFSTLNSQKSVAHAQFMLLVVSRQIIIFNGRARSLEYLKWLVQCNCNLPCNYHNYSNCLITNFHSSQPPKCKCIIMFLDINIITITIIIIIKIINKYVPRNHKLCVSMIYLLHYIYVYINV